MSGVPGPARSIVRLRQARLDAAQIALAESRGATRLAVSVADLRAEDERAAHHATVAARATLGRDPDQAEVRLALLDRSRLQGQLAVERRQQAERELAEARAEEAAERARLLRAQARHQALDAHVGTLARAAAVLAEEREALEEETGRRPR